MSGDQIPSLPGRKKRQMSRNKTFISVCQQALDSPDWVVGIEKESGDINALFFFFFFFFSIHLFVTHDIY